MSIRNAMIALASLAALGAAPAASAQTYNDAKFYSAGSLCTPYTSGVPDYSKLRFRPGGVTNEANNYQYVICSLPMDTEVGYLVGREIEVAVGVRSNTVGTTQCTVTLGTNAFGTQSFTQSAPGVVGNTVWIEYSLVAPVSWHAASMVCRIAPKHTLTLVWVQENDTITDGNTFELL